MSGSDECSSPSIPAQNDSQAEKVGILDFVTGFKWLVYQGQSIARQFADTTRAQRAQRAAIGLSRDNSVLVHLVADRCENWYVSEDAKKIPSFVSIDLPQNFFLFRSTLAYDEKTER